MSDQPADRTASPASPASPAASSASPAADLWSLGMTLYVSVEGTSPMRRGTSLATLAAVLDQPVPPPAQAGPLAPVLSRLLVTDPDARPDPAELDSLLADVASGGGTRGDARGDASGGTRRAGASSSLVSGVGRDTRDTRDTRDMCGNRDATEAGVPPSSRPSTRPLPDPSGTSPRRDSRRSRVPVMAAASVVAVAVVAAASYRGLMSSTDTAASSPDGAVATATVTATATGPSASGTGAQQSPGAEDEAEDGADEATGADSEDAGDSQGSKGGGKDSRKQGTAADGGAASEETSAGGTEGDDDAAASPAAISPESFAGSWIVKLDQTWADSGTAQRDQHLEAARAQVPDAQVLLSSNFQSMGSGYWVIYVPRSFDSGTAAIEYCATLGRTTKGSCMGRYLSHDSAHQPLMCEPDGEGGTTGRCTGP